MSTINLETFDGYEFCNNMNNIWPFWNRTLLFSQITNKNVADTQNLEMGVKLPTLNLINWVEGKSS